MPMVLKWGSLSNLAPKISLLIVREKHYYYESHKCLPSINSSQEEIFFLKKGEHLSRLFFTLASIISSLKFCLFFILHLCSLEECFWSSRVEVFSWRNDHRSAYEKMRSLGEANG